MRIEELEKTYGPHVAKRVTREVGARELEPVSVDQLCHFLQARAERFNAEFKACMANPLEQGNVRCELLQMKWHDAEELAYLLSVADDVSHAVRAALTRSA